METMLADCIAKGMERGHLREASDRGTWSIAFVSDFVREPQKTSSVPETHDAPLAGEATDMATPLQRVGRAEEQIPRLV